MPKERVTLERKYRKGARVLPEHLTQHTMKHIPADHRITKIEFVADGLIEVDDVEHVFHTLRVLIKPPQ